MSRTQGEGRAQAEKAQSVRMTAAGRRAAREARAAEDAAWAAKSGPVTVRRAGGAS